jgi:hypothetical protein
MIELRFHHELYDGFAVDEAVKVFAELASAELAKEPQGYLVRLTALAAATAAGLDEGRIALELSNYALGKTIERIHGAPADPEASP